MTVRTKLRAKPWLLLASLAMCLGGCQQMMPGASPSKVAAARRTSPLGGPDCSEGVTKEQKADFQMAVAHSLETEGQIDQAIKAYRDVVARDSRRADAYHRLAVLHDKKGEPEVAEKYYRIALQRDPKNAEAWADFGYSCYLREHWEESEKCLRRAVALAPELARAHNNLGLLLARNRRQDEAIREFAKAGCTEAEAHANLAYGLAVGDDWQKARLHYQTAMQLDPRSRAAQKGLVALDSGMRKMQPPVEGAPSQPNSPEPSPQIVQTALLSPQMQPPVAEAPRVDWQPEPIPQTVLYSPQVQPPVAQAPRVERQPEPIPQTVLYSPQVQAPAAAAANAEPSFEPSSQNFSAALRRDLAPEMR